MENQKIARRTFQQNDRSYAIMVAKALVFTIEDLHILGFGDENHRLEKCLFDIMEGYDLETKDIKVRDEKSVN